MRNERLHKISDMRILSINNYHYVRGGAEKVFLEQNKRLRRSGAEVAEFCMRHDSNQPSAWERFFVSNLEFNAEDRAIARLGKAGRLLWNIESRKNIDKLIRHFSPTLAHIHNIYHHISFSILPVLKKHGLPVVMTLHDLKLLCPSYTMYRDGQVCHKCATGSYLNAVRFSCVKESRLGSLVAATDNFIADTLGVVDRHVDAYVVPSQFYRDLFSRYGIAQRKLFYIPNFTELHNHSSASVLSNRFLYFGRLSREKGVHVLIKAAGFAGVKLAIAGSGPEEPHLRQLATEAGVDCDFLGHITGSSLLDAIQRCRAVVVPSIWYENAPLTVLEALKNGKAVIASRIGGIPEILSEGKSGFLFEPYDFKNLGMLMQKLNDMTDHEIIRLGSYCRESASKFNVDAYIQRITDLYTHVRSLDFK